MIAWLNEQQSFRYKLPPVFATALRHIGRMSVLGHKRIVCDAGSMSALPPKADISLASKSHDLLSIIAAKPPNDKDG